jgi:hypothetical protein
VVSQVAGGARRLHPFGVRITLRERAEVLEQERHPAQRPSGSSPSAAARAFSNSFVTTAFSSPLSFSTPLDGGVDQLPGEHLTAADQFRLGGGVHEGEIVRHPGASLLAARSCFTLRAGLKPHRLMLHRCLPRGTVGSVEIDRQF